MRQPIRGRFHCRDDRPERFGCIPASGGLMNCLSDVALAITSCGRFDLLQRTLASMRPWIDRFPHRFVVEDSAESPDIFNRLEEDGFTILVNGSNLGQHRSIDHMYARIDTKYILHCEDDWEFSREPDFEAARLVLDNGIGGHDRVSLVCFHDFTRYSKHRQDTYRYTDVLGARFRYSFNPGSRYNSFTFNPCVLRRDLTEVTGPYESFLTEGSIARFLRKRGYIIATEIPGLVRHIGETRHISRKKKTASAAIWQWIRKGV